MLLAVVASRAGADATTTPSSLLVLGGAGATRLRVLACETGALLAEADLRAPQSASVAMTGEGDAVLAATSEPKLLRLSLPGLHEEAAVPLAFTASVLAVSHGADATLLLAGSGAQSLTAFDPRTLATLHEYRDAGTGAVSAIVDAPARARFTVGFADSSEAWEIAYGRHAPPVLQGLVHDYRMREAVELPGRFTPRRFALPGPTRTLVGGVLPQELLRIDTGGRAGIVQLDVRREIEHPAFAVPASSVRIAPWGDASRHGWVAADEGASELHVLEATGWRAGVAIAAAGEIRALAGDGKTVLVAIERNGEIAVARLEVASRRWTTLARLRSPRPGNAALQFVEGTSGCIALVDGSRHWLAGFRREREST